MRRIDAVPGSVSPQPVMRTLERIRTLKTAFLVRRLSELEPVEQSKAEELVALLEHLVEP